MTTGQRVRAARLAAGWTPAQLAEASGLTLATISRVENGKRENPASATLEAIARALNVPADSLLGMPSRSPSLDELRRLTIGGSPAALRFLAVLEQDYDTVSDETWHTLTQVLQAMITHDRAQQVEQGQRRTGVHTNNNHTPETVPGVKGC